MFNPKIEMIVIKYEARKVDVNINVISSEEWKVSKVKGIVNKITVKMIIRFKANILNSEMWKIINENGNFFNSQESLKSQYN